MIFASLHVLFGLLLANLTTANPLDKQSRQNRQCSTGTFSTSITLPSGVSIFVEQAVSVPNNGAFGEGAADQGFSSNAIALPSLCAVIVNVTDKSVSPQSNYRFGIFLPDQWNTKLLTVGSYSFAGGINWPLMGEGPHYQMATLSTDNGHNSIQADLTWATPARLFDWGWRAMHGSVQIGKLVTKAYYGQAPARSSIAAAQLADDKALKKSKSVPTVSTGRSSVHQPGIPSILCHG